MFQETERLVIHIFQYCVIHHILCIPDIESTGLDGKMVLKEWKSVSSVEAVKNNRVYIISNDYAFIPGPRFILFLEVLARIICPEIKTSSL